MTCLFIPQVVVVLVIVVEHIKLPGPEEVKEGIIAARIAAHAADLVKKVPGAQMWDDEMSLLVIVFAVWA